MNTEEQSKILTSLQNSLDDINKMVRSLYIAMECAMFGILVYSIVTWLRG